MLRCRRCRKGITDSSCLLMVEATDESSATVCSIWHMNVDTLPDWILTSVQQAQWTQGKLSCQHCAARLGGFNFLNRTECPCGRDAAVHLSKSRVDRDAKNNVLIIQPRRTRPRKEQAGLWDVSGSKELSPALSRTALDGLQLNCVALMSHSSHSQASGSLSASENSPSFSFSPLHCLSDRRRSSLEDDAASAAAIRSSCFCPSGGADRAAAARRAEADASTSTPVSQRFDRSAEASPCQSFVPGRTRSPLRQPLLQAAVDEQPHESSGVRDEAALLGGRALSDSEAEQDHEVLPPASAPPPASNRWIKRENNRRKAFRRKQRRRERWLQEQLEQELAKSVSASLLDSEEEDREGLTCAVCLDVYFSPYSCQPCGHIFCEPCLRTIARNRPSNTPCPLCRSLVSHTTFQKDLNETARTVFPKVYQARKQNFQNASCAKWPLPSGRKRFRAFWGEQRRAGMAGRRWHFGHAGFALDALDLTDMRGWLFDIGLVIVYIHSVNWIVALLFLGFLLYYFCF